jgi:integrase
VPPKVVAALMGHAKVDTTINVYTQVLDGAARDAATRVGSELARIVQTSDPSTTVKH